MGCWNGTCGVSQLPIISGSKVKAFLLLQSKYCHGIMGSGTTRPTSYFLPWFFPVTAEYNDYGGIENITNDWNSKFILNTIQEWLALGKIKILDRKECEVGSPNITKIENLQQIFDCVERGSLVFINSSGITLKIGIFLILEDIFDAMIDESNRFIKTDKNNEMCSTFYKQDRIDFIRFIQEIRENNNIKKTTSKIDNLIYELIIDRVLNFSNLYELSHYSSILCDPKLITIDEFIIKLDELNYFSITMSFLRKMWIPQTGQGSQSEELCFNQTLIDAMSDYIKKRNIQLSEY